MASPAHKGTSGGGERISMAVLRNSDSGDRHQIRSASSSECSRSIWQRIRRFHPNELATDVVLRSAPAVSSGTRRMAVMLDWPAPVRNAGENRFSPQQYATDICGYRYAPALFAETAVAADGAFAACLQRPQGKPARWRWVLCGSAGCHPALHNAPQVESFGSADALAALILFG
jgi:hypothetical protein